MPCYIGGGRDLSLIRNIVRDVVIGSHPYPKQYRYDSNQRQPESKNVNTGR